MMKSLQQTLLALALIMIVNNVQAEVVIATETSRGEYENGVFTPGKPEFRYRFEVNEKAGTARLTETIRLKNNSLIELNVDYVITTVDDGANLSSLLMSEGRRKQKIFTLVGQPGTLATEVILLGEKFFEYCKASSGRLYVATGTVERAISPEEDTSQLYKEGSKKQLNLWGSDSPKLASLAPRVLSSLV